jgi:DNA gyrase subunit A
MDIQRPDLTQLPADVIAYIEALESALESALAAQSRPRSSQKTSEAVFEPSEPPTTINIISVSASGLAKRTPRHLYGRQRRGGMGIFDLDSPDDDPPFWLAAVDEEEALIVFSDRARLFRVPVRQIAQTEPRGRGESLPTLLGFNPDERIATIIPASGGTHLILVSRRGQVKRISAHYFGPTLRAGTVLYDVKEGGPPAAACWSSGNSELFLLTRQGRAIRFAERLVPVRGCLGMRVNPDDHIVGVAAAAEDGGLFMINEEGKGTIRLLSGFSANKSPGSGGKTAMKSETMVGVSAVDVSPNGVDDLFVISQLGKLIRFRAAEVPPKEGVVQGVNCMNLRSDHCMALTVSRSP